MTVTKNEGKPAGEASELARRGSEPAGRASELARRVRGRSFT